MYAYGTHNVYLYTLYVCVNIFKKKKQQKNEKNGFDMQKRIIMFGDTPIVIDVWMCKRAIYSFTTSYSRNNANNNDTDDKNAIVLVWLCLASLWNFHLNGVPFTIISVFHTNCFYVGEWIEIWVFKSFFNEFHVFSISRRFCLWTVDVFWLLHLKP